MTQPRKPPPIFTTPADEILPRAKPRRTVKIALAGLREALAVTTLIFGLVAAMYIADLIAGGQRASWFSEPASDDGSPTYECPHGVRSTEQSVIDNTVWTITICNPAPDLKQLP